MKRYILFHKDIYVTKFWQAEDIDPKTLIPIESLDDIDALLDEDENTYEVIVIDLCKDSGHMNPIVEQGVTLMDNLGIEYRYVEMEPRPYLSVKAGE